MAFPSSNPRTPALLPARAATSPEGVTSCSVCRVPGTATGRGARAWPPGPAHSRLRALQPLQAAEADACAAEFVAETQETMQRGRSRGMRAMAASLVALDLLVCSSSSASGKLCRAAVTPLGGPDSRASTRTAGLRGTKLRGAGPSANTRDGRWKRDVRELKWLALRGGGDDLPYEEPVPGKDVEGWSHFREDSILDYSIRDPYEDSHVSLDLGDGAWDPALTDPTTLPFDIARERLDKPQNFSIWMQVCLKSRYQVCVCEASDNLGAREHSLCCIAFLLHKLQHQHDCARLVVRNPWPRTKIMTFPQTRPSRARRGWKSSKESLIVCRRSGRRSRWMVRPHKRTALTTQDQALLFLPFFPFCAACSPPHADANALTQMHPHAGACQQGRITETQLWTSPPRARRSDHGIRLACRILRVSVRWS